MKNDEKIAALEAAVAELKARDDRREREHRSVLAMIETLTGELRRDTDRTLEMQSQYYDTRIKGLADRLAATGDAPESTLMEIAKLLAEDTGNMFLRAVKVARDADEANAVAIVKALTEQFVAFQKSNIEGFTNLADRLEALERVVFPRRAA